MDKIQHCRHTPQLAFAQCPECGITLEKFFHNGKHIHRCPKCGELVVYDGG